jgi:hypothetical protein
MTTRVKGIPDMRTNTNSGHKWMGIAALALLSGCASPTALHHDYDDYSEVYADGNNKQLLLNLAREAHQDPEYFIQLASISSQYQFTTTAGFSPSATRTAPAGTAGTFIQHALTLGGSVGAGVTQQPVFSFVPLTGSNFVQAIMSPISDKVFLTFYDQGWPANWVARTMLDSIEIKTNLSTRVDVYVNDPADPTYPRFLDYCDRLRNMQFFRRLVVDRVNNDAPVVYRGQPKLSEVVSAVQAGLSVTSAIPAEVTVRKAGDGLKFVTNTNENEYYAAFQCPPGFLETNMTLAKAQSFATNYLNEQVTFKTRTFASIMNSVAAEESLFSRFVTNPPLTTTNITFTKDPCGPVATVMGKFKVRPIMRLQYNDQERARLAKLVEVKYQGEVYTVGDFPEGEEVYPYDYDQNRAVFTMISYLFSQAAISTQNLPVQQLIQVQ